MLQIIPTLRDFLDDEQLKWLPKNLKVEMCMILTKHEEGKDGITRQNTYIFDQEGCLIGKIDNNNDPASTIKTTHNKVSEKIKK